MDVMYIHLYVCRFMVPSADIRGKLWRQLLPPGIPMYTPESPDTPAPAGYIVNFYEIGTLLPCIHLQHGCIISEHRQEV